MSFIPSLGRWLQDDPIGFGGGDVNLYRSMGNNPVNLVDSSGLASISVDPILPGEGSHLYYRYGPWRNGSESDRDKYIGRLDPTGQFVVNNGWIVPYSLVQAAVNDSNGPETSADWSAWFAKNAINKPPQSIEEVGGNARRMQDFPTTWDYSQTVGEGYRVSGGRVAALGWNVVFSAATALGAAYLTWLRANPSNLKFTSTQLQKKFKHAGDFGIAGNANKANLQAFEAAIARHIQDNAVQGILGTYRGNAVMIYVNPQTGLAVITDVSGSFISGWKLSPQQLHHVLNGGKLGGG
jgi:uncharacterized protein RhaS with RHS repeats